MKSQTLVVDLQRAHTFGDFFQEGLKVSHFIEQALDFLEPAVLMLRSY